MIFYVFLFCIIILILRREITEESLDRHLQTITLILYCDNNVA